MTTDEKQLAKIKDDVLKLLPLEDPVVLYALEKDDDEDGKHHWKFGSIVFYHRKSQELDIWSFDDWHEIGKISIHSGRINAIETVLPTETKLDCITNYQHYLTSRLKEGDKVDAREKKSKTWRKAIVCKISGPEFHLKWEEDAKEGGSALDGTFAVELYDNAILPRGLLS